MENRQRGNYFQKISPKKLFLNFGIHWAIVTKSWCTSGWFFGNSRLQFPCESNWRGLHRQLNFVSYWSLCTADETVNCCLLSHHIFTKAVLQCDSDAFGERPCT